MHGCSHLHGLGELGAQHRCRKHQQEAWGPMGSDSLKDRHERKGAPGEACRGGEQGQRSCARTIRRRKVLSQQSAARKR